MNAKKYVLPGTGEEFMVRPLSSLLTVSHRAIGGFLYVKSWGDSDNPDYEGFLNGRVWRSPFLEEIMEVGCKAILRTEGDKLHELRQPPRNEELAIYYNSLEDWDDN